MKKYTLSLFIFLSLNLIGIILSSKEKIQLALKKVEVCNSCKHVLADLRKEKNSNICDLPNYDKILPDYFFAKETSANKGKYLLSYLDCEICSNLDKCSFSECVENKKVAGISSQIFSRNFSNSVLNNVPKNNQTVVTTPTRKNENKFTPHILLEKKTILKKNKEGNKSKNSPKFEENFEQNAINYLNIVKNKLSDLSNSISNFININSNTIKFKQNLIKLYLYIKIKNQFKDSLNNDSVNLFLKSVEDELKLEKTSVFNLKNYFGDVKNYQSKIKSKTKNFNSDYYQSVKKIKNLSSDSKERIKEIENFLKGSKNLLRDVEGLTSRIYNDNLVNLKSFREVLSVVDRKIKQKSQVLTRNINKNKEENLKKDETVKNLIAKIKSLEANQAKLVQQLKNKTSEGDFTKHSLLEKGEKTGNENSYSEEDKDTETETEDEKEKEKENLDENVENEKDYHRHRHHHRHLRENDSKHKNRHHKHDLDENDDD